MDAQPPKASRFDDNRRINRRNGIGLAAFVIAGLSVAALLFMLSPRGPWADPCSATLFDAATRSGEAGLDSFLARCASGPRSDEARRRLDELRRTLARTQVDDAAYRAAKGSLEGLERYVRTCDLCRHRQAAANEAATLRLAQEKERRSAELAKLSAWWKVCSDGRAPLDRQFEACTAIIASMDEVARSRGTAFYNRGNVWSARGDRDRAIVDYTEAIKLNPTAVAHTGRGNAWFGKRDYDRAITDYTEAIRLNPKYAVAYGNRGLAFANKGDRDRAIVDYTEAIRLNPKFATAYFNRGLAWAGKGDYDRAIADYDEAIGLNPKHVDAYYNRGLAWAAKGDHDRAIAAFTEAIRLNPKHVDAHYNRGLAWRARGDTDRAIADLKEALALGQEGARKVLRELGVEL